MTLFMISVNLLDLETIILNVQLFQTEIQQFARQTLAQASNHAQSNHNFFFIGIMIMKLML